jgi:hypothetical protein
MEAWKEVWMDTDLFFIKKEDISSIYYDFIDNYLSMAIVRKIFPKLKARKDLGVKLDIIVDYEV